MIAKVQGAADREHLEISRVAGLGSAADEGRSMTLVREVSALRPKLATERALIVSALRRLEEVGLDEAGSAAIRQTFSSYEESLQKETSLIDKGLFDEAFVYDRRAVLPHYIRFVDTLQETEEDFGDLSASSNAIADKGTFAMVLLALAGLLGLHKRAARQRERFQDELEHQAFHDSLTGLANRVLLKERLEHALARARRRRSPLAVLFIDLDGFKRVNDSLGHDSGDMLLVGVGERLVSMVRDCDTVARLGGDEFAIILEEMDSPDRAAEVADRLISSLLASFEIDSKTVSVTASVGIAVCEAGDSTSEELLANADVAMYSAKGNGKARYETFRQGMKLALMERMKLQSDLAHAIDRDELQLHFQPMVDLRTRAITGAEALVRWEHPDRGLLPPSQFIPLAEETGLIVAVDRWVLKEAVRQAKTWQDGGQLHDQLDMSINVSALLFQEPSFVEGVREVIKESGVDPRALILEITESTLMLDSKGTIDKLRSLKRLGVKLAIDDFGTGYSSLSYLRRFPVDVLKIDRSFVEGVTDGPEQAAIIEAIVKLAHDLRLRTVAEGIESADQLRALTDIGCTHGQGYFFARPLPNASELDRLIVNGEIRKLMAATDPQLIG